MKRILIFAFAAAFLSSCAPQVVATISTSALDYSIYQKNGLFLTESNSVSFDYEPLASLSSLHLAGVKDKKEAQKLARKNYFSGAEPIDVTSTDNWYKPTREKVLLDLCNKAKELGANGIINIRITYITSISGGPGYEASGMAIKR